MQQKLIGIRIKLLKVHRLLKVHNNSMDAVQVIEDVMSEVNLMLNQLDVEVMAGNVKIKGCDKAAGFEKIIKESDLQKVGKEIFKEHPGEEGFYNFTKFLWVEFPDGRKECRLDDLVSYD